MARDAVLARERVGAEADGRQGRAVVERACRESVTMLPNLRRTGACRRIRTERAASFGNGYGQDL